MLPNVQPVTSSHLKLEEQNSGSEADKEKDSKFKDFPATSILNYSRKRHNKENEKNQSRLLEWPGL